MLMASGEVCHSDVFMDTSYPYYTLPPRHGKNCLNDDFIWKTSAFIC